MVKFLENFFLRLKIQKIELDDLGETNTDFQFIATL